MLHLHHFLCQCECKAWLVCFLVRAWIAHISTLLLTYRYLYAVDILTNMYKSSCVDTYSFGTFFGGVRGRGRISENGHMCMFWEMCLQMVPLGTCDCQMKLQNPGIMKLFFATSMRYCFLYNLLSKVVFLEHIGAFSQYCLLSIIRANSCMEPCIVSVSLVAILSTGCCPGATQLYNWPNV